MTITERETELTAAIQKDGYVTVSKIKAGSITPVHEEGFVLLKLNEHGDNYITLIISQMTHQWHRYTTLISIDSKLSEDKKDKFIKLTWPPTVTANVTQILKDLIISVNHVNGKFQPNKSS